MGASGASFRLDPGWLFVTAGLTLCAAGVLVPAQQRLDELRGQLARIENAHVCGREGIEAHERFLDRLRQRDPAVIRRLAAAQLNLMPAGETPVLVASSAQSTVADWIGGSVDPEPLQAAAPPRTWLALLTQGTRRLWVLGAGILLVFVGLIVDGRGVAADVEWSDNGHDEDEDEDLDEAEDEDLIDDDEDVEVDVDEDEIELEEEEEDEDEGFEDDDEEEDEEDEDEAEEEDDDWDEDDEEEEEEDDDDGPWADDDDDV